MDRRIEILRALEKEIKEFFELEEAWFMDIDPTAHDRLKKLVDPGIDTVIRSVESKEEITDDDINAAYSKIEGIKAQIKIQSDKGKVEAEKRKAS